MRLRFDPSLIFLLGSSLLVGAVLFVAGCNSAAKTPQRPLTVEEQHGKQLFAANCANCHSAYKNEALQGPALVGMYRKDLPSSGRPPTDAHVRETIMMGRKMMPAFNMLFSDRQVDDLIAYLHTL